MPATVFSSSSGAFNSSSCLMNDRGLALPTTMTIPHPTDYMYANEVPAASGSGLGFKESSCTGFTASSSELGFRAGSSVTHSIVCGGGSEEPLKGHSRYTKIRDLNRGAYGFVQLARDAHTGQQVAIKFVRPADSPIINKYIQSEVLNHRKLQHPCVIGFKGIVACGGHIGVVMEYASGGSLYSHLRQAGHFPEPVARWFFQQLIIGLDYCHCKGVVNRDIKLNNMLVQVYPGQQRLPSLKIADFGYSKAHSAGLPTTKVGTLPYMAPEVFRTKGPYDAHKSDVWSCAVVLFWMLFGRHPFQPESFSGGGTEGYWRAMLRNILANKWCVPGNICVSEACKDLLTRMLTDDPQDRAGIADIYEHPWFKADLPIEAEAMKHRYVGREDYSALQSEAEICGILRQAMEADSAW